MVVLHLDSTSTRKELVRTRFTFFFPLKNLDQKWVGFPPLPLALIGVRSLKKRRASCIIFQFSCTRFDNGDEIIHS